MCNPTKGSGIQPVQAWPDNQGRLHLTERDAVAANLSQQYNGAMGRVVGFLTNKGHSFHAQSICNSLLDHWDAFLPLMEQLHHAKKEYSRLGR